MRPGRKVRGQQACEPGPFDRFDKPALQRKGVESALRFAFLNAPRGLNFNVLLYYRGDANNYSQLGLNLGPQAAPFNVDFSFADLAAVIADPTRPADFSRVSGIYIVTQSGGYTPGGGEGFVISSIAAVPEPESWALMLAGLGVVAAMLRRRPHNVPARSAG